MTIFLFLIIPISSLLLLFLKDVKKLRGRIINFFIITNNVLFILPILCLLYITSGSSHNSMGSGATVLAMVIYPYLFPLCLIIQVILLVLKLVFRLKKKTSNKNIVKT